MAAAPRTSTGTPKPPSRTALIAKWNKQVERHSNHYLGGPLRPLERAVYEAAAHLELAVRRNVMPGHADYERLVEEFNRAKVTLKAAEKAATVQRKAAERAAAKAAIPVKTLTPAEHFARLDSQIERASLTNATDPLAVWNHFGGRHASVLAALLREPTGTLEAIARNVPGQRLPRLPADSGKQRALLAHFIADGMSAHLRGTPMPTYKFAPKVKAATTATRTASKAKKKSA